MLKEIKIRKGQYADLKELQLLFVETITDICRTDYDSRQIEVWTSGVENQTRWNEIMDRQFVLVAEYETQIVGFATLANDNYLDLLYVHKHFQRQRIAYGLYADIEKEAIRRGQTELTADVSITARPFFEKVGFNIMKEQLIIRKDIALTNYKMFKKIN